MCLINKSYSKHHCDISKKMMIIIISTESQENFGYSMVNKKNWTSILPKHLLKNQNIHFIIIIGNC